DHVHLLLPHVRVAVRKAIAGRDALVAQGGLLELERLRRCAELQIGRAVEPGAEVFQIFLDVGERERHGVILRSHFGAPANRSQRPSDTTSTVPSVTLMAVWSSIAYAGTESPAAHASISARGVGGRPSSRSRCGKTEKSTSPSAWSLAVSGSLSS